MITVQPGKDVMKEEDETIVLIGTATDTGLTDGTATITITDDDVPSTGLELSVDPPSVSEGSGSRTITVTADLNRAARTTDTVVRVAVVSGGTATAVDDYAQVSPFTITIPAGSPGETRTFTFVPVDDDIDEPGETVQLQGTASGLTAESTILQITDDDAPSTSFTLSANPTSFSEASAPRTVTVTARLDAAARTVNTDIQVTLSGGTATAGSDYETIAAFTITILKASCRKPDRSPSSPSTTGCRKTPRPWRSTATLPA